jgi:hypothetical protein
MGNDEDSILRVYGPTDSGSTTASFDISAFVEKDQRNAEVDVEGVTRIGDILYWIGSHGANSRGKSQPSARRLFATRVAVVSGKAEITPLGKPYENLVEDLIADPAFAAFDLEAAAKRAPKTPNALNIEGLTATPTGGLLIGFRNPIPHGRALLVPLENPREVVEGKARAKLGAPVLLSLGGLGVRSIEYSPARREYLIVAGPDGVEGPFHLYTWTGSPTEAPQQVPHVEFTGLQPEALIVFPETPDEIVILSDDGTRLVDGVQSKDLPPMQREFRSLRVRL